MEGSDLVSYILPLLKGLSQHVATMHTLDLLILLVLAGGMVRGASTGVVRQVASLVGLLLTFVLAVKLMEPVGALVTGSLGLSERVTPLAGFIVVFLALQVLLFAVIRIIETLIGALKLTAVNRVLGGLMGMLKAALALSVVFLLLGFLGVPEEETQANSTLYRPVAEVLPDAWGYLSDVLPEVRKLTDRVGERVDDEVSRAR